MSTVEMACAGCGERFEKRRAERDRQVRRNPDRAFYCTRGCYADHQLRGRPGRNPAGNPERLVPGNRQDAHSPFRYFVRKARSRRHVNAIDEAYLADLWSSQRGRCAVSGVVMDLPRNGQAWERRTRDPWKPSLDRLDPEQGYVPGNVRFVCVMANLARGRFTDAALVAFCRQVTAFQGTGGAD